MTVNESDVTVKIPFKNIVNIRRDQNDNLIHVIVQPGTILLVTNDSKQLPKTYRMKGEK